MSQSPSTDSSQGWVSATFGSTVSAGTVVQVVDSSGDVIATFTAQKSMGTLTYSSADVESGATYSIETGGTATGDEVGGLADSGSADGASELTSVTAGTALAGMGGGPGGGGGPMGGARPGN
jgi:hypothetical protein